MTIRRESITVPPIKPAPSFVKEQLAAFGSNLKEQRMGKGWTLDDLAAQSGLSKAFLSRLESGSRQASISAILTLSQVFGNSVSAMFQTRNVLDPCLVVRKSEAIPRESGGFTFVPLSRPDHSFNLRAVKITISRDRTGSEHFKHDGEEWFCVLSGRLTLSLGGGTYDLEAGDAVQFDARIPHRLMARGKSDPMILAVTSLLPLKRSLSTLDLKGKGVKSILWEAPVAQSGQPVRGGRTGAPASDPRPNDASKKKTSPRPRRERAGH